MNRLTFERLKILPIDALLPYSRMELRFPYAGSLRHPGAML